MATEGTPLEGDSERAPLCPYRGNEKEFGGNVCSEILHLRGSGPAKKGAAFFQMGSSFPMWFSGEEKGSCSPSVSNPPQHKEAHLKWGRQGK